MLAVFIQWNYANGLHQEAYCDIVTAAKLNKCKDQ